MVSSVGSRPNLSVQNPHPDPSEDGLQTVERPADKPTGGPGRWEAMVAEDRRHESMNGRTRCHVSQCSSDSDPIFRPTPVPDNYPELNYKPVMLRSWSMLCVIPRLAYCPSYPSTKFRSAVNMGTLVFRFDLQ